MMTSLPPNLQAGFYNEEDKQTKVVLESLDPDSGILLVTLNRHKQFNAMNDWMYLLLIDIFHRAANNPDCKLVVITGSGSKAFCAGADLNAGFDSSKGPLKSGRGSYYDPVGRFMSAVISFPKPLIAACNGIGVGVGLTMLPLCDMVFCVPHSTFSSPFTQLAVTPEFCSSLTFPRLLGTAMATEVLVFGRKLSAQEAKACGLVHDVCPDPSKLLEFVYARVRPTLAFPFAGKSMKYFKTLLRSPKLVQELEEVHRVEMLLLDERAMGANSQTAQAVKVMLAEGKKKAAKL
jgi:peroxisomal 3,2-trans-enoyl-CoA isomerase